MPDVLCEMAEPPEEEGAAVSLVLRGLSYPQTRRQAYRVVPRGALTRAQLQLLEGAGEDEFTRFVKSRARLHGWRGWHLRDSEGVIESVHTLRFDGFCDGLGLPDWQFWHEDLGQHFLAELKGAGGTLGVRQKTAIASLRRGGTPVFVWWPRDALQVEHVFEHGLGGEA